MKALKKIGEKVDYAIDVDVPDENNRKKNRVEEELAYLVEQHTMLYTIQLRLKASVTDVETI